MKKLLKLIGYSIFPSVFFLLMIVWAWVLKNHIFNPDIAWYDIFWMTLSTYFFLDNGKNFKESITLIKKRVL